MVVTEALLKNLVTDGQKLRAALNPDVRAPGERTTQECLRLGSRPAHQWSSRSGAAVGDIVAARLRPVVTNLPWAQWLFRSVVSARHFTGTL